MHTPGPWEVELIVGLPRVISDSTKSNCRCVADLHIDEGVGALKTKEGLRDEIAANARLIAAAPDMLEALRSVEQMIDESFSKFNWGASFLNANAIRLLNEVPIKVAKTIARAEGR
jgi:hypothetical protein